MGLSDWSVHPSHWEQHRWRHRCDSCPHSCTVSSIQVLDCHQTRTCPVCQAAQHHVLGYPTRIFQEATVGDKSLLLSPDNLRLRHKAKTKRSHGKEAGGSLKAMLKDAQPTG